MNYTVNTIYSTTANPLYAVVIDVLEHTIYVYEYGRSFIYDK